MIGSMKPARIAVRKRRRERRGEGRGGPDHVLTTVTWRATLSVVRVASWIW